jgi:hypothetical protein
MKRTILTLLIVLLAGCAAQSDPKLDDAIEDFIAVSGLEELDTIKSREQFGISELSERYVLLTTRKDTYLARFTRRCYELNENQVTPDIRYDRWTLRARFDTIRGCRIEKFFAIDSAQAEELEMLALSRSPERG